MAVLAGNGEKDAKFGCPVVGQVWIEQGFLALCLLVVLACGNCMTWDANTLETSYFQLSEFLPSQQQYFLTAIQFLVKVVGKMIWPRLNPLGRTERTRNGQFSVGSPTWRLVRSMQKPSTGLSLNRDDDQNQPRCQVRMRAQSTLRFGKRV